MIPVKTEKAYIGIDPGVSGGVGLIYQGRPSCCPLNELPPPNLWGWLVDLVGKVGKSNIVVVMEQLTGYAGKDNMPGARMFELGKSYGRIEGLLVASGIEHLEFVHARTWQKAIGIKLERGTKPDYDEWKRKLKEYAINLFPESRVIAKTADAILLAHYGRMKWG